MHGQRLLPPDGHLSVSTASVNAAKAGLAMYTACRRPSLAALRFAWDLVDRFGPGVLPGFTRPWTPPLDPHAWDALVKRWTNELGRFDDVAMHLRRPRHRAGASILLLDHGVPIAFVKVRSDNLDRLDAEQQALVALHQPMSFSTPAPLSWGVEGRWHYLAMSALPPQIHTMVADPPLARIIDDIGAALRRDLRRPPGTPAHWEPLHGDLTPWNLRALDDGTTVLFDWEATTWGPPRADLLWYDAVVAAVHLRVRPSGIPHSDEAAAFWIERLEQELRRGRSSLSAKIRRWLLRGWRG